MKDQNNQTVTKAADNDKAWIALGTLPALPFAYAAKQTIETESIAEKLGDNDLLWAEPVAMGVTLGIFAWFVAKMAANSFSSADHKASLLERGRAIGIGLFALTTLTAGLNKAADLNNSDENVKSQTTYEVSDEKKVQSKIAQQTYRWPY